MEVNKVNERIRTLRAERNWTQQELGDLLGVTAQAVSKWETGLAVPDIALLPKLSALFRCSIDSLFGTEKVIGVRDFVTTVEGRPGVRCSFCGIHQDDVWRLIAGPEVGVYICSECMEMCGDMVSNMKKEVGVS